MDIARVFQPDVVHLNGYAHGALPWDCPALVVAHSCVLSWWQAVKREPIPPSWDAYRIAVRRGLSLADLVVAPTIAMLRALQRHYGMLTRTRVIPNGRGPMPTPGSAKTKEPLVLSAGRLWDEAKNVAALATVAHRVKWPVFVAGDTRSPQGDQTHLDGVRLLGPLAPDELATWFTRASIYCLPARYEPFGLSALEAALAGCALVLGDIDSLREVWNGAALFVPPDDAEALAGAVNRLIDSPALRRHLATAAAARAADYSPRRMADAYMSAYRELIAIQSRRPAFVT